MHANDIQEIPLIVYNQSLFKAWRVVFCCMFVVLNLMIIYATENIWNGNFVKMIKTPELY